MSHKYQFTVREVRGDDYNYWHIVNPAGQVSAVVPFRKGIARIRDLARRRAELIALTLTENLLRENGNR